MTLEPFLDKLHGGTDPRSSGNARPDEPQPIANSSVIERAEGARRLSIYEAAAGFSMVSELDHLAARSLTPNIFFNPRFLAPAMPRLDDRDVSLAILRDERDSGSRLRFLLPFSVERPGLGVGSAAIRCWANDFGPLGTPLVDHDDPVATAEDFLKLIAEPSLRLPSVLLLPDIQLQSPAIHAIRTAAIGRDLPVLTESIRQRPALCSNLDGEEYLERAVNSHHRRNYARLKRRLSEEGRVTYEVARQPDEIRMATETFLSLELMSWKGRNRTAMASDRFQSAFAREALNGLAERDMVRIHQLKLDGETIASLIVLVERGQAFAWKTTYDETLKAFSPGLLLMVEATSHLLDDPNVDHTDSCSHNEHPMMSRLWTEEVKLGTLVIGLTPHSDRKARQFAAQLHLYRGTRSVAKSLRKRVRSLLKPPGMFGPPG